MSTTEDRDLEILKLQAFGDIVSRYRKMSRKDGPLHQQMRAARAAGATQAAVMAASGLGSLYRVRVILGEADDPKTGGRRTASAAPSPESREKFQKIF
jgi:hypothetical protein